MDQALRPSPHVRGTWALAVLLVLAVVVVTASVLWGRYPMTAGDVWRAIVAPDADPTITRIVTQIRAPRIAAAMLVGMALAVAGTVYQGMFRNPLVSPDLLGASAGAGFGASLAIVLGTGLASIQILAFGFGLLAVLTAWSVSRSMRRDPLLGLILAGIVVSAVFSAGTSFLKYVADPNQQLPAITFWLMGGFNGVRPDQLPPLAGIIVVCGTVLWLCRWRLNVISFSDESARTLGVDVRAVRALVVVAATLITTASVSVGGLISWVGLVVPHLVRLAVGPDFRRLLPLAAIAGAIFLLIVDDIARNLTTMEVPLGILTALVGGPFMLALILRDRSW